MRVAALMLLWTWTKAEPEPPPMTGRAYSNHTILMTLYDEVLGKLEARHAHVTALNTSAAWRQRQAEVRDGLGMFLGPLPPASRARQPRLIEAGTARRDGFHVRKLLVESRPGYWIPAGLWVPDFPPAVKRPAILYAAGHEGEAWRWDGADDWQNGGGDQIVQINLVKRGFVVLGFDPIGQGERQMDRDLDPAGGSLTNGSQSWSPTFEHEYLNRQLFLSGTTAAATVVWDMTVLMDVLENGVQVPEVDSSRLGVAGCSGGGTQAAYFAAVDARAMVASVACYMSTFAVDYAPSLPKDTMAQWPLGGGGPAEGEQTWGPAVGLGTAVGLDKPDLLQIRAPRPSQILLTTEDQCFPIRGGLAAVAESRPAFELLAPGVQGASSATATATNLTVHQSTHWHGYARGTREALYGFLMAAFNWGHHGDPSLFPPGDPPNTTELYGVTRGPYPYIMPFPPYFRYSELLATSTGNVLSAPEINGGNGSLSSHDAVVGPAAAANLAVLADRRQQGLHAMQQYISAGIVGVIGYRTPVRLSRVPVPASAAAGGPLFVIPGEGRCNVTITILEPTAPAAPSHGKKRAIVMYVARKGVGGDASVEETRRLDQLRAAAWTVAVVDVCGFGTAGDQTPGGGGDGFGGHSKARSFKAGSQPVDVAFNLGRSVVGIHAADVIRAAQALALPGGLAGQPDSVVVATISANETAAAVLHASVLLALGKWCGGNGGALGDVEPSLASDAVATCSAQVQLGDVALVGSIATWESIAAAERYDMGSYFSFVFGGLKHWDLTDLLTVLLQPATAVVASPRTLLPTPGTAQLQRRCLVLDPTDAAGEPLSAASATNVYAAAVKASPPGAITVTTGGSLTAHLLVWLGKAS